MIGTGASISGCIVIVENDHREVSKDEEDALNMEWSPKVRQVVKAQNPSNGELSHGVVTKTVHARV